MLKRVCDRCKQEIDVDNDFWFQMKCDKMDDGSVFCGAGIYELCDICFNDFKSQLANNN